MAFANSNISAGLINFNWDGFSFRSSTMVYEYLEGFIAPHMDAPLLQMAAPQILCSSEHFRKKLPDERGHEEESKELTF